MSMSGKLGDANLWRTLDKMPGKSFVHVSLPQHATPSFHVASTEIEINFGWIDQ